MIRCPKTRALYHNFTLSTVAEQAKEFPTYNINVSIHPFYLDSQECPPIVKDANASGASGAT